MGVLRDQCLQEVARDKVSRVSTYDHLFQYGKVKQQVDEHERRLNSINGSVDGLRDDVDARMDSFDKKLTDVFIWMKVAFILGQILTPVIVGVVMYLILRG